MFSAHVKILLSSAMTMGSTSCKPVLSLPHWRCYRNFDWTARVAYECTRRVQEVMASLSEVVFGWDDSHYYAHTEAKYTGIMPVLSFV